MGAGARGYRHGRESSRREGDLMLVGKETWRKSGAHTLQPGAGRGENDGGGEVRQQEARYKGPRGKGQAF